MSIQRLELSELACFRTGRGSYWFLSRNRWSFRLEANAPVVRAQSVPPFRAPAAAQVSVPAGMASGMLAQGALVTKGGFDRPTSCTPIVSWHLDLAAIEMRDLRMYKGLNYPTASPFGWKKISSLNGSKKIYLSQLKTRLSERLDVAK